MARGRVQHHRGNRSIRVRSLLFIAALALGFALQAATSAATAPVIAWPGTVVTYKNRIHDVRYRAAIASAAAAWNRLGLGVTFEPARGPTEVTFYSRRGPCLLGRAGLAPYGFQISSARVGLSSSCPAVVQPLLVAHELGRVLGLPTDDTRCSLMNSHAVSDGLTYAIPAKCSRAHRPKWMRKLVDPGTASLARRIYSLPPAPSAISLSLSQQGLPEVAWDEQPESGVAASRVARSAACPTDRDLATGSATILYDAAPAPGHHAVLDSTFPTSGQLQCFRAFSLNAYGRATPSPDAIAYGFGGPLAGFTATTAAAGSPTSFADNSVASNGAIARWSWNFGDPTSGSANILETADPAVGEDPTHVYTTAGEYVVTLTVTDGGGRVSMMLQQIVIAGTA